MKVWQGDEMSPRIKINRNDPCPCGSAKKYKYCCEARIDWNRIIKNGEDQRRFLSIRGRNIWFVNKIAEILQLDNLQGSWSLKNYKKAFTAQAVKSIHEAVMQIWPVDTDIHGVLENIGTDVSGLYIGDYGPDYISRGIVRHSIYANKILIVDPFIYPKSVRDEFNPILNPEQYRTQTLKNVNFYFSLLPWVDAGIVEIIRTPDDFDPKLKWDSMVRQREKFKNSKVLQDASERSLKEMKDRHMNKEAFDNLILSAPDDYLRRVAKDIIVGKDNVTEDDVMAYIHRRREGDPNFLEPLGPDSKSGQIHTMTTGASYEIARLTASITRSYLVTDLYVKWKEIELDRENNSAPNMAWTPFAKAFQGANLRYLNELRLDHALVLRKEGRLEGLRNFLRKTWKNACTEEEFSEANAQSLADELVDEIRRADEEWKQIDRDLLTLVGLEASGGVVAAGPLIASGHAEFLAAAALLVGGATLVSTTMKRKGFQDKFPAGFFIKITEN